MLITDTPWPGADLGFRFWSASGAIRASGLRPAVWRRPPGSETRSAPGQGVNQYYYQRKHWFSGTHDALHSPLYESLAALSLSELASTETEERLMAAAASMGLRRGPPKA